MRIAVLNWRDLAHDDAGGAEVYVHEVGSQWVQAGQEVTLFSSRAPYLPASAEKDGVKIERVGRIKNGTHHLRAPQAMQRGAFDVVFESVNTFPYLMPLRRSTIPVVPLIHQMALDVWNAHLPHPLAALAARAEPHLYRPYRDQPVLAVSESTKSDLTAAGVRDVSVVTQGGIGPQASVPEKEPDPTFIFVGRLSPNKRPDHALQAFHQIRHDLPNARLWMVGEGAMKSALQESLPEGAELLGRIPRPELLDRIGRAHVLLATSIREGWGLVVTEACALGTPSVAYRVPGLVDSVKPEETGILVDAEPEAMGRAATRLVLDHDRYRAVAANARTWGEAHSWERTAGELLSRFEHVRAQMQPTSSIADA